MRKTKGSESVTASRHASWLMFAKHRSNCGLLYEASLLEDECLYLQVTNTHSALYHIHLIESGAQATGQLLRVIVGPKVHKEQVRHFHQHVTVQGRHFNAVVSQSFDHRVDFTGEQHKVSRYGCIASACGLEVNGLCNSHHRRNFHFTVHDLVGAWNGELIDSTVYFSTLAHDLIDLLRINSEVLIRSSSGRRSKRSLTQGERIMNGLGDFCAVTHRMNVHIHYARRFMQHVIVQSRWFDSALLKFRHNWCHFVFGEHKIAHHQRHVASLLECDPRAKSKGWL